MPMSVGRRNDDHRSSTVAHDVVAGAPEEFRCAAAGAMRSDHDESGVDLFGGTQDPHDCAALDASRLPAELITVVQRRAPLVCQCSPHLTFTRLHAGTPVTEVPDQTECMDHEQLDSEILGQISGEHQTALCLWRTVDSHDDRTPRNEPMLLRDVIL